MKNVYNKFVKFSIILTAALLSGCSRSSESFDTEPGKGVGFRSISEVNTLVENGKIEGIKTKIHDGVTAPIVTVEKPSSVEFLPGGDTKVMRRPEEHIRVWVAPFQDESGNFHEGSVVHTLLNHGTWHMFPKSH